MYVSVSTARQTRAKKINDEDIADVIVMDMLGNIVLQSKMYGNIGKGTIDVSSLAKGVYTYQFVLKNCKRFVGKIIVE